jgi:hypothetical protein
MSQGQQRQANDGAAVEGIPLGLRRYSPYPFKGIDLKAAVTAIEDESFVWLENLISTGPAQLAFLNSNTPAPLYGPTTGTTIVSYYFFRLAPLPTSAQMIVFRADGTADVVRVSDGVILATLAGPFNLATPPVAIQWADKYLLIADAVGYYVWDGTIFYKPGTLAPQASVTNGGLNYASPPTIAISGGSGTGATATPVMANGQVVDVTITNPGSGYLPTDQALINAVFTGGGSTNKIAQGIAAIGGGGVLSVSITDGGTGYTNQPAITFSGGGASTQATAVAQGTANSITTVLIVTPGVGYTSDPAVSFAAPSGGGDTATGNASIALNGILSVTVTDAGSGYSTVPTVQLIDPTGFGSGATAVANMSAGTVASVTILNPGQNYQQVIVKFVGGNPSVAAATLQLMPSGGKNPISGRSIEIFKSRVWLVNGTYRYTSAPGSVSDFAATDGGIIAQNTDAFLSVSLYGLKQANGFLYEFGDSSINAISNPITTVTNNLSTTQVTVTNIDPQIGTIYPATIQNFGEAIVFANQLGVYELFGSSVKKISSKLDKLFVGPVTQTLGPPSAAIVIMFSIKFYALCYRVFDPVQRINRQLILLWDGFEWYAATQDASIIALQTLNQGGTYAGYGSDGTNIYSCFTAASFTLPKKLISKYYGMDAPEEIKQSLRFYLGAEAPLTYAVTIHSEVGDSVLPVSTFPGPAGPAATGPYGNQLNTLGQDAPAFGKFLGWTLTSTTATCVINYMGLSYVHYAPYF